MESLKTIGTRNLVSEHNCNSPSKLLLERQCMMPRRIPCLYPASAKFSKNRKLATAQYPINQINLRLLSSGVSATGVNLEQEPSSSSEEQSSNATEVVFTDASGKVTSRQPNSDQLKSLLADSERSKLIRKLSEANQYNRFLKRQLQIKDDVLASFKNELAVLELELQALVGLAEEVANSGVPAGSRKINGKYIQSHLLSRLEVIHDKIKEQIKDVESLKPQEVSICWVGIAESVQVKGSFDGWTYGEEMSPEYSGDYARFTATLKLRPGRYEIKFLVDGEWHLSPEFPTIGEGMLKNNLLIVE